MGNRSRYFETVYRLNRRLACIVSCICLYLLRILLQLCFVAFYKENHGLEVPRETRLDKLMRLLEVSKKTHRGKPELSTKTILGVHFRSKSQMEKIKGFLRGVDLDFPVGVTWGGHYYDI